MTAEEILDRFSDEEICELEKYYLGTLSGRGVCHDPLTIARVLLRLSRDEQRRLASWAGQHFQELPSTERVAA